MIKDEDPEVVLQGRACTERDVCANQDMGDTPESVG